MPKNKHVGIYFYLRRIIVFELNKKLVILPIAVGIAIIFGFAMNNEDKQNPDSVFHVTLADPDQYTDGLYLDTFFIYEGTYSFRFVPNGDSPKNLGITLQGQEFEFIEEFILKGTPHQTGISEYYTWDYEGQNTITISESQQLKIIINPHDNVMGPVSVFIQEN